MFILIISKTLAQKNIVKKFYEELVEKKVIEKRLS